MATIRLAVLDRFLLYMDDKMSKEQQYPLLQRLEQDVSLLSRQFDLMAKAFLANDKTQFEVFRGLYCKAIERHFRRTNRGLYGFLGQMIDPETDDQDFYLFSSEAELFHAQLGNCIDNLQGIVVGETYIAAGEVYKLDNRIIDFHQKEKEFLFPLYKEHSWLMLSAGSFHINS